MKKQACPPVRSLRSSVPVQQEAEEISQINYRKFVARDLCDYAFTALCCGVSPDALIQQEYEDECTVNIRSIVLGGDSYHIKVPEDKIRAYRDYFDVISEWRMACGSSTRPQHSILRWLDEMLDNPKNRI